MATGVRCADAVAMLRVVEPVCAMVEREKSAGCEHAQRLSRIPRCMSLAAVRCPCVRKSSGWIGQNFWEGKGKRRADNRGSGQTKERGGRTKPKWKDQSRHLRATPADRRAVVEINLENIVYVDSLQI